jgi:hypothetical protein
VDGWNLAEQLTDPKHTSIEAALNAFDAEVTYLQQSLINGRSFIDSDMCDR